ncbi:MAG TPA: FGGY family carbohydrate kinase [Streptosporangiaceae bacterium]|nr:FGGY family carbohydrate kinase [Streptosporangiaceae bacterium]
MTEGYLLALDAGTGSCRAALFGLDGELAGLAQREWSHPPVDGVPGSQSFDPAGSWAVVCACVREVISGAAGPAGPAGLAAVRAVGCSSMGGGLVLYDRRGREVWACANGDARAGREAAAMLADGTAAELYRRGGGWISITAPPRLAWVRRHQPGIWAEVRRFSMIADWMVLRLTGTLASEASIGSTSGLFDLGRRAWSPELLAQCGLDPAWFPEVVEAGTVVGQVSARAAAQTGLAAGTPVVAGGLDTALGLAGPGPAVPGRLTVTGGSFWKQTVLATAPVVEPDGQLRTICHVRPGEWLVEGIGFYAGFALRWLRDQAAAVGQPLSYAELEALASAVPPGAHGLTARLVLADAWTWARWQPPFPPQPAAATGAGAETGAGAVGNGTAPGLGERARAIQEAAAYSTRRAAGLVRQLLGPTAVQQVLLVGGAARSRLWPQILADVLGCPVSVAGHTESAALGAAILAGRAAGVLPDAKPLAAGLPAAGPGAATQGVPGPAAPGPPAAGPPAPGPPSARPGAAGPDVAGRAGAYPARAVQPSPGGQRAYDNLYAQWISQAYLRSQP